VASLTVCPALLYQPTAFTIPEMFDAAVRTYAPHGLDILESGGLSVDDSDLWDVDAGRCRSSELTDEQLALFDHRVALPIIHVYFVRSTDPPYNGCAAHPPSRPGVIVTSEASIWTLAHELGHMMGLRHAGNETRLMTGDGTSNITKNPPDLVPDEIRAIMASPFVTG